MKLLRSLLPVAALLCVPVAGLKAEEFDSRDLYKRVVKSSVFIVTQVGGSHAMGSGSLIDLQKKLVLTNYHVVDEEETVFVQFPMFVKDKMITDKKKYMDNIPAGLAIKGKVLYRDKGRDLALVELASVPPGTPAIKLAKKSPEQAEEVWNVGSPGDVNQVFSVTRGEVRAVAPEKLRVGSDASNVWTINAVMVTATNPVNPGDSGGPLVNKKGEQVAVTESSRTRASLVNFFVDITEVRALLKEKKITIKEDDPAPAIPGKKDPKKDLGANKDAVPPKKDNGTGAAVPPKKDNATETGVDEKNQKEAAALLSRAKLFKDDPDQKDYFQSRLNDIIKKYPGTDAAKEAKRLLDGLR